MSRVKPFVCEGKENKDEVTMVAQRVIPFCNQDHRQNLMCIKDLAEESAEGTTSKTFVLYANTANADKSDLKDIVEVCMPKTEGTSDINARTEGMSDINNSKSAGYSAEVKSANTFKRPILYSTHSGPGQIKRDKTSQTCDIKLECEEDVDAIDRNRTVRGLSSSIDTSENGTEMDVIKPECDENSLNLEQGRKKTAKTNIRKQNDKIKVNDDEVMIIDVPKKKKVCYGSKRKGAPGVHKSTRQKPITHYFESNPKVDDNEPMSDDSNHNEDNAIARNDKEDEATQSARNGRSKRPSEIYPHKNKSNHSQRGTDGPKKKALSDNILAKNNLPDVTIIPNSVSNETTQTSHCSRIPLEKLKVKEKYKDVKDCVSVAASCRKCNPPHISLAKEHGISIGHHPYDFDKKELLGKSKLAIEQCFAIKSRAGTYAEDPRVYLEQCKRTKMAIFLCDICGGVYESERKLSLHKQVTLGSVSQPQDLFHEICLEDPRTGKVYDVISPLVKGALYRKDKDTLGSDKCMIKCKSCSFTFESIGDAITHVGRAHLLRPYMYCHLCGSVFCKKEPYLQHLTRFHPQLLKNSTLIPCHCCHKDFDTEADIREHYSIAHGDPFLCKICNMQLLSVDQLLEHLLHHCDHGQPTLTQCPICGDAYDFRYFSNHVLVKHTYSDIHNNDENIAAKLTALMTMKCDFCDKTFTDSAMLSHRSNGSCKNVVCITVARFALPNWKCKKCRVTTYSFYEWRQHAAILHADLCASETRMPEGAQRGVVWPVTSNSQSKTQCLICGVQWDIDTFDKHLESHLYKAQRQIPPSLQEYNRNRRYEQKFVIVE